MAIPMLLRYKISNTEKFSIVLLLILTALFSGFVVFYFYINESYSLIVNTKSGAVSGRILTTVGGREVFAFLGVPYAEPPTGEFRFREARPVEKWEGIKLAHHFGPKCIQFVYYKMRSEPVVGEEDCLFLNVFSPVMATSTNLDVIFYIHGGGFMYGGSDMVTPDHILDRSDVVVVTVNYRLGPFGFLTTEDGVIPGNLGLKDQLLALRWVSENINRFGGDKNKITIAGLSAGGASVHLHMLSPMSKNLFHRAISMSGTAFCPWVFQENAGQKAKTLACSVACPTNDTTLLLECLQSKPSKDLLLQLDTLFMPWYYNPFSPFGVVVEGDVNSTFLPKHPLEIIKANESTDVPWLTSATTEEGLYPAASFINDKTLLRELDYNWNEIAPSLLDFTYTTPKCHHDKVSEEIRRHYFNNDSITKKNRGRLVKMLSDRLFLADIEKSVKLQASFSTSPVYFYLFGYRGKHSLSEGIFKLKENLGVSHGDDMMYLMKSVFKKSKFDTEDDKEMSDLLVNVWISFIKSGTPSVGNITEWLPVSNTEDSPHSNYSNVSAKNIDHLMIYSSKNISQISTEDLGNYEFWSKLNFTELFDK